MRNMILAGLAAILGWTGLLPAQNALAQTTAVCAVERSVSEQINDTVAPVTDAVSAAIFYAIPVKGGGETATGHIRVSEDDAVEGDVIGLALGDRSVTFELDRDGATCESYVPVDMSGTTEATAAALAQAIETEFRGAEVRARQDGPLIAVTAPSSGAPELFARADGLFFQAFDDGSIGVPLIVIWLFFGAIFFTLKMRFVNLRAFTQSIKIASGKYDDPKDPGEVTHFQALTAALSGTVGLGNIAGVALAISIGGPGATFWMILVGLFGMTSKFTECTLGLKYRQIDADGVVSGGPMYYLSKGLEKRGLGRLGRLLAILFAVLCIGSAFGAGNMFQINQSSSQFMDVMVPALFGENSFMAGKPWIVGLIYAGFVGLVILGGIRSITRVTERLVPLMAFIYVTAALIIIIGHIDQLPSAFGAIFEGAFAPEGVAGGFIGVLVQGMRRGTFSNEAGVGSAAIAHSAAKTKEPVAEGLVALLEPFIDTVVICTMTALVIIITGSHEASTGVDGITLTSSAFETVISWFPIVLSIAVLLFAFSTSITWYYYGERAFLYLVGTDRKKAELAFKVAFLSVVVIGSAMQLTSVMDFADAMLLAMAFPNMIGLYIMSGEVKRMLDDYLGRIRSGVLKPYKERAPEPAAE